MDPDARPEIAPAKLTLRDNFARCDTPFFSEQFTLPVQRNYSDFKSVLCHPGNPLHDLMSFDSVNQRLVHENRDGMGSENFFEESEKSGNLRILKTKVIYYNIGDDLVSPREVEATILMKGPKMETGARSGDYEYKADKARYNLTAAIIAECPDNTSLEGILCAGRLTYQTKEFFVDANRFPSVQTGPGGKSGVEVVSKILKRNQFKRASSTVEMMGAFTSRLRKQVDAEFSFYEKQGVYETESEFNFDTSKIEESYATERTTQNEKLKDMLSKLTEKGLIQDLPTTRGIKSPLESPEIKNLILEYDLRAGKFAYGVAREQRKESLQKLLIAVATHSQLLIANRIDKRTLLQDRVRKVKEYHLLTEKHEDFRADEVRPALLHNQTMLYPEDLLAQLVGHYYLGE